MEKGTEYLKHYAFFLGFSLKLTEIIGSGPILLFFN